MRHNFASFGHYFTAILLQYYRISTTGSGGPKLDLRYPWVKIIPVTQCFCLRISVRLFISKLQRRKLLLIQTRIHRQDVGKFSWNFSLTQR